ncbi:MAG: hypothetical protein U1F68_15855 [Gammaproteobacteria bacterium]
MNTINGNQAADILYRFLGEAGLAANRQDLHTRRDELFPQAVAMLRAFHADPALELSAYPPAVQHYAVLLINLMTVELMQEAEAFSARLPDNLTLREQAAWLIGRELTRDDRWKLAAL